MEFGDFLGLCVAVGGMIAMVGIMGKIYLRRLAFKEREMVLLASQTAEKAAQYAAHTERLEARVQVLERIATDKGTGLAREIEDLRSTPVRITENMQ